MSNAAQDVKQLIEDMIADRKYYTELNALLEQQRQLIVGRRSAELDQLNGKLIQIYERLAASSQQRYATLAGLGVPAGPQGIKALFSRLPVSHQGQVSALWEDLETQATRCKTANEGNGLLLGMQQEILENLVNSSEPENWLYQQV
ncbi:flagellar export chaperone FlgN [Cedecea sp. S5-13]|jgi:flagella synthesis protein FlgN|uniref:flagellar export chaperone FlgN n=1 Tax=Cedecea selenatireducens TaxID=3144416 RepID=UPI0035CCFABB